MTQPGSEDDLALQVHRVSAQPQEGGRLNVTIETSRGDIPGVLHPHEGGEAAVIWVCGAVGGLEGPANGIYPDLGDALVKEGLTSLRLDYRMPNHVLECALDALAGVSFLKGIGAERVALVGHSFGGAVVIAAGTISEEVKAVVALSTQTAGATGAGKLSPRALLLVHGGEDTRLPVQCSEMVYDWAREPKEIVIVPGAGHGLRECRDELFDLLKRWLVEKLAA